VTYSDAIEVAIGTPVEYSLHQNYPNPFNPRTTIKFAMKEAGNVELKVYNVMGQLIATLVNAEMKAGVHAINFNGDQFASGVYFYSVKANGFQSVKKMMLVK
jgi:hypothetical protein